MVLNGDQVVVELVEQARRFEDAQWIAASGMRK